jgi:hypothetical protein|uniref:Myb-like domain-containing protein n=1 Tax=Fagus sylvatica TaxID=28930 RepID=A0A2N9IK66_FAGSY
MDYFFGDNYRWSPEEEAIFQDTLKEHCGNFLEVFERIAAKLPTKTLSEIKAHFGARIDTARLLGYPRGTPNTAIARHKALLKELRAITEHDQKKNCSTSAGGDDKSGSIENKF